MFILSPLDDFTSKSQTRKGIGAGDYMGLEESEWQSILVCSYIVIVKVEMVFKFNYC